MRVELAPRALAHVRQIETWWRANRPAAPTLFSDELIRLFERLAEGTAPGVKYPFGGAFEVRRALLARSRYHVYYSLEREEDLVKVRAVWHAARGRGPALT
jgi:plasmid stabilization system protein ParE